jgi:FHA domain-containing protein/type VI secretion system protein
MPVKLLVKTYRDQPPATELSCLIETDGLLGRSAGNDLVLEDPGKYISRSHARVEGREEGWFLIDIGSNPSVVNERLLGNGRQTQLQNADQLVIGDYCIEVMLLEDAIDPDQTGIDGTQTLAVFSPPPSETPAPLEPLPALPVRRSELGFSQPELQTDALADASILQGESTFDPQPNLADPLGLNLCDSRPPASISGRGASLSTEPLLPAFRGAESDHLSPERHALPLTPSAAQAAPSTSLIPDEYDALADHMTPAPSPLAAVASMPAASASSTLATMISALGVVEPVEPPITEPVAPPVTSTAQTAQPVAAVENDAVFQALLDGLGLPELRALRSPEALARLVGEMLREATGGTMGVLMARALTKRESHIDMTMIGARFNNPLKFFPDPASALGQMLSTDAPAYLPGVQALRAAFDDLRAHEMSVIAGMREALSEVVQRFDPALIDHQMGAHSALDRLMPSGRKARAWDRLNALYAELVRDGDEDLHRIFGEKFSVAYQQQVSRLRDGR